MNQIYLQTLKSSLKTQIIVPVTLDCEELMKSLVHCLDLEPFDVKEYQNIIDSLNTQSINQLIKCINILEQHLFFGWKINIDFIEGQVKDSINSQTIITNDYPNYLQQREQDSKILLFDYYKKIQENVLEYQFIIITKIRLMDTLITQLIDDCLSLNALNSTLQDIIDVQLHRLAYDLFEFAYINDDISNRLILKIQDLFTRIVNDFFIFIIKLSFEANTKMHQLNELLDVHQSLANFENFQYMYHELAQEVINYGNEIFNQSCFSSYINLQDKIIKQALKHFYYTIDNQIYWFQFNKYSTFTQLINSAKFAIIRPMPQHIQIYDNSEDNLNILEEGKQIFVIYSQKVSKQNHQGLKLQIQKENNNQQTYYVYLVNHYLMFHQNSQGWEAIEQEQPVNKTILEYINEHFDYLHQHHPLFSKRVHSEKSENKSIDEGRAFTNVSIKYKYISAPKKPIKYGTQTEVVGAKALGLGLGYLIVDCFDEDLSWEEKLEHAGFTAVSFGALGLLAARLPVIGLIIQQVILAIAVKSILDNKVISDSQTYKNIGHLTIQIIIGVACTIAGSIIFHVAFWGAFFGGLIGGVGMGVYGKLLVPYAMENLIGMLNRASILIRKCGVVRYKTQVFKYLLIDEKFIENHKPDSMSYDQFFTLLMFTLINEVKLVAQAQYHKQIDELKNAKSNTEVNIKMAEILKRKVEIEVALKQWNGLKIYLKFNKISLVDNVGVCAQFVEGMLSNFKIK